MKKNPSYHWTMIVLTLIVSGGCGPTLYLPNQINAPLMAGQGDYSATAAIEHGPSNASFELQTAYAVHNNIGLMANYSGVSESLDNDNHAVNQQFVEGGLGYFNDFGDPAYHGKRFRFEVFSGFGRGWSSDIRQSNDVETERYTGKFHRYFIQPSFGFVGKVGEVSVSGRLAGVTFDEYRHLETGIPIENMDGQFKFGTFEPAVTGKVGYRGVKFFMQFGRLIPLAGSDSDFYKVNDDWDLFHISLGVNISPWGKDTDEPEPEIIVENKPVNPTTANEFVIPQPEPTELAIRPVENQGTLELNTSRVSICLRDGGQPDGDVITVSYQNFLLVENLFLDKNPHCYELAIPEDRPAHLVIHAIAEGKIRPNTVWVKITESGVETVYYIRTEAGKSGEIILQRKK